MRVWFRPKLRLKLALVVVQNASDSGRCRNLSKLEFGVRKKNCRARVWFWPKLRLSWLWSVFRMHLTLAIVEISGKLKSGVRKNTLERESGSGQN